MEDKKIEETIDNPEEPETPDKKTGTGEGETPEKTEGASIDASELEEKNKKLYARTKKAEEELKTAKEQLEKSKTPTKPEGDDVWKSKVNFLLKNRDKNYSEDEFGHISVYPKSRVYLWMTLLNLKKAISSINGKRLKKKSKHPNPQPNKIFPKNPSERLPQKTSKI